MKRKLGILLLLTVIGVLFYFYYPQEKSYEIPDTSWESDGQRPTNDYFQQKEFEWFLITPDRVPLFVLEAGAGENVVALHGGFGMDHAYMRRFLESYEQDYHMIYYDQRGSLRSPVPGNKLKKHITMENMVNDLELLRRAIGDEQLTLIAHSMGAVLAYEYLKKYPKKVKNLIIISGFPPRFPASKAAFKDMLTSQKEREAFKDRPEVKEELEKLSNTLPAESEAYRYLNWKVQYAACQIYNFDNWQKVEGGLGFFNPKMNQIIGPESNIPWIYGLKFYRYQRQFNQGKLETVQEPRGLPKSPLDYLPVIKDHPYEITYLLGRYEVGDWNLRLYNRYLSDIDNVDMHIFEKSCHNIWMDEPIAFHQVLSKALAKDMLAEGEAAQMSKDSK